DREGKPCARCKSSINRIKIGSRSAYFCPRCQILK
ncbi:MAG: zinc finger domain-containing protein, partial [Planctomycetota bacterium]|nr:zinc finger domain-containing protein [Planctomycetota bacterium]